jgi:hypothetical protein
MEGLFNTQIFVKFWSGYGNLKFWPNPSRLYHDGEKHPNIFADYFNKTTKDLALR